MVMEGHIRENRKNADGTLSGTFHFHLHVYPCWEGKEVKAIGRFVSSVTDPENVTDEIRVSMMRKIRKGLATVQLAQET